MSALVQLAAAGLICGMMLTLCSGSQKELLRLGCACLLVILIFSKVRDVDLMDFGLRAYENSLQGQVDERLALEREALLQETEKGLDRELERQAAAQGITCSIQVCCRANETGIVTVEAVTVSYRSGVREHLSALRDSFAVQLGVDPASIIIQEDIDP